MTQNQVAYLNYAESKRNNIVVSQETNRHNLATEGETNRHNIVTEKQEDAKIAETGRHNLVTENETGRHNLVTESQTQAANSEIARHNKATEKATRIDQRELHRHNLAGEKQQRYNTDKQTAASIYSTQVGAQTASKRMAIDKALNSARLDLEAIKNIRDNKTKVRVSEIAAHASKYNKTIDQVMQDKRLSQEQIFRQKELKKEYAKIMADLARTEGQVAAAGLDALTKVMNGMLSNATGSKKK